MGKKRGAAIAAGAAATAAQPGGLRKIAAVLAVLLLTGALVLGGGLLLLVWWAKQPPEPLGCATDGQVSLYAATGPFKPGKDLREAVAGALEAAGRTPRWVKDSQAAAVRVQGSQGEPLVVNRVSPLVIRSGKPTTAAEVGGALSEAGLLAPCAAQKAEAVQVAPTTPEARKWPWEGTGFDLTASGALLGLLAWWTVGPPALRLLLRVLAAARAGLARLAGAILRAAAALEARSADRKAARAQALLEAEIAASAALAEAERAQAQAQHGREAREFENDRDLESAK